MPGIPASGLLVDRAEDLVVLPPGAVQPIAPADSANGCIAGTFELAGHPIHLLRTDRLLTVAEQAALAALTEDAEQRRDAWSTAA